MVVRDEQVFLFKRLRRGGEKRLFDKLSIGIGGHVNPEDAIAREPGGESCPLENGSRRELAEELTIEGPLRTHSAGILNDDSNPVGAVHVGLVQVVHVEGDVSVRETDVLEGRWASIEELRRNYETNTPTSKPGPLSWWTAWTSCWRHRGPLLGPNDGLPPAMRPLPETARFASQSKS